VIHIGGVEVVFIVAAAVAVGVAVMVEDVLVQAPHRAGHIVLAALATSSSWSLFEVLERLEMQWMGNIRIPHSNESSHAVDLCSEERVVLMNWSLGCVLVLVLVVVVVPVVGKLPAVACPVVCGVTAPDV
jgi:hypothetical protein